jgi:hypothetical protein
MVFLGCVEVKKEKLVSATKQLHSRSLICNLQGLWIEGFVRCKEESE